MKGMQMDEGDAWLLERVTRRFIGRAFRIANALGYGFVADQLWPAPETTARV
jgi:hypothetical protein